MKAGFALSAALLAAASVVARLWPGTALPRLGAPPEVHHAVQDVGMAMSGVRRFGGDAAFVEFLQYLGGSDIEGVEQPSGADPARSRAGWLPKAFPLALRIAGLSPHFHGAHLFTAGTLGFVLDRPEEALALLEKVARLDPTFWRYRLYAGAIAYRQDESTDKVVALLEEALKYPDCPSMLQNILAHLHKKLGNYRRAAEIYAFTAQTSRDPDAVSTALHQLERLKAEGKVP